VPSVRALVKCSDDPWTLRLSQRPVFSRIVLLVHLGLCIVHVGIQGCNQSSSREDIANYVSVDFAGAFFEDAAERAGFLQDVSAMITAYATGLPVREGPPTAAAQQARMRAVVVHDAAVKLAFLLELKRLKAHAFQVRVHGVSFLVQLSKQLAWRTEVAKFYDFLGVRAVLLSQEDIQWVAQRLSTNATAIVNDNAADVAVAAVAADIAVAADVADANEV
jgi:hypothetical protein